MNNAWNVLYKEDERLLIKVFEGDSPKESGAVPFAKELRLNGITAEVISRRRAFAPQGWPYQVNPPAPGLVWCPYCVKWREYEEASVVHDDYETPSLLRCTVCTISIKDFYVRKYNPILVERYEIQAELNKTKVPTQKVRLRRRR